MDSENDAAFLSAAFLSAVPSKSLIIKKFQEYANLGFCDSRHGLGSNYPRHVHNRKEGI
jgi:hypothetical protein